MAGIFMPETIKQWFAMISAIGGVAFGMGGYAASRSLSTQQQVQQVQLNQLMHITDKVVTIQESQSREIDMTIQWIKDHEKVTHIEKGNVDALRAGPRGR